MKRQPLSRKTGIQARKPMSKVSAKRRAQKASQDGQAGLAHMARIAQLPCVVCGAHHVEVHHCIHDRYSAAKASDFDTIPLCRECHASLHAGKETWRGLHGPDHGFLPMVAEMLTD